jgi:hypothetical protein
LKIDINTADMTWQVVRKNKFLYLGFSPERYNNYQIEDNLGNEFLPAWSLTSLIKLLPDGFLIRDNQGETESRLYSVRVPGLDGLNIWKHDLVDACYEMILKLHESKML